jgi:hypothetical protein
MRRRTFLAASAAAAVGLAGSTVGLRAANAPEGQRQFFELRTYHFPSREKREAFERFLAQAAIPAFNRAGVKPVGAWVPMPPERATDNAKPNEVLYVFLPHDSLESVVALAHKLAADEAYQQAGHDVLNAPKQDPAFTRYESTLLHAMEGFPRVATMDLGPSRVLELRTYESRSAERAVSKLAMFNAGEFDIFTKAGMHNVFFGGAIIGENLPQLTYMVAHASMDEAKKNWKAFGAVPEWKTLSAKATYKDNVSQIIDHYLRPTEGSQI